MTGSCSDLPSEGRSTWASEQISLPNMSLGTKQLCPGSLLWPLLNVQLYCTTSCLKYNSYSATCNNRWGLPTFAYARWWTRPCRQWKETSQTKCVTHFDSLLHAWDPAAVCEHFPVSQLQEQHMACHVKHTIPQHRGPIVHSSANLLLQIYKTTKKHF